MGYSARTSILLICCMVPLPAQATCCAIPSVERLRNTVELAKHALSRTINENGRAITEQLVANNASQNRALQEQTRVMEALLKSHAATLNAMEAERLYGTAREVQVNGKTRLISAQSPSLCRQLQAARALHAVPAAHARARTLVAESQRHHNEGFASSNAATDRLRRAQRQHIDLSWMHRDILSETDTQHAVESIKNLINPYPLPRLDSRYKTTPQGKTYLAKRAVLNQKYQLAQDILNDQLLLRAPLIKEGHGTNSILNKMQERVDETIEDHREDSWVEQLERKALAGLLRELNINLMHLYRLGMHDLRTTQDTSRLLATLLANDTHRLRQGVQEEYTRVLATDVPE